MYGEAKVALFIYLWYPKTRVRKMFFFFKIIGCIQPVFYITVRVLVT